MVHFSFTNRISSTPCSRWALNAYVTQQYYRDFQRAATGLSPTVGYPLTPDLTFEALGYTIENIEISQSSALRRAHYLVDETGGINSAVNTSLSYDTRNNRLFPTSDSIIA